MSVISFCDAKDRMKEQVNVDKILDVALQGKTLHPKDEAEIRSLIATLLYATTEAQFNVSFSTASSEQDIQLRLGEALKEYQSDLFIKSFKKYAEIRDIKSIE